MQLNLARVHARLEFLRLINWKVAWAATQGALDLADASSIKVFGTEFYLEAFRLLMEILGPARLPEARTRPDSVLQSRLERMYRGLIILTFGGGMNEVQRDLIAVFGLGMPLATAVARNADGLLIHRRAAGPSQDLAEPDPRGPSVTHERLKELEAGGETFDRELWAELAEAGLLGIALPEAQGGGGLGFLEAALVLEQVGRTVAPVPYCATVVLGALPIARVRHRRAAGTRCLPGVVGRRRRSLTAALVEVGADPLDP